MNRKQHKEREDNNNQTMGESDVSSGGRLNFSLSSRWGSSKVDTDGGSVISNASTKGSLFGKTIIFENDSSSGEEDEGDASICPNEFVIQCKDDETVFVTATHGRKILKRCRQLRELMLESCQKGNGQVLHLADWPASNVRRMIELLTTGMTWIENDAVVFSDFEKAAKDMSVDVRLTSLINYHDMLNSSTTRMFFRMMHFESYQFKISAMVRSSQWLQLLKMGILLMSKSKVLALKLAKVKGNTGSGPSEERLTKCDKLCSEFCVYASGNMRAVLSIANILSPWKASSNAKDRNHGPGEEIKIIVKIRKDSLSRDELALLWRMTDSSFTMSTPEEQAYLSSFQMGEKACESEKSNTLVDGGAPSDTCPERSLKDHCSDTVSTVVSSLGVPNPIAVHHTSNSNYQPGNASDPCDAYYYRTLTGKSFLALKHLFDPINVQEPDLAACLLVQAPTPDTLGRLINATKKTSAPRLDFQLQENIYFACKISSQLKTMLSYMSDYSSSAVIKGDFHLCQRVV